MRKKFFLLFIAFAGFSAAVTAQLPDRSQLEKERKDIQKELSEIQGAYNQVKGQTKQTLGQLNIITKKMNLQEQYIGSINKEIKGIDDDIYLSNLEIYRLTRQLDTLKAQYAKSIVYAYKNRSNYDYLNFIFSANNFNDAIRRISYLKSYRAYREKQVENILATKNLIAHRNEQQLGRKQQKNAALTNQNKQVEELALQKKEKDEIVKKLKSKEKDFVQQIAVKKKRDKDLNNAIGAIIRRAQKEAEDKAKAIKLAADAKRKADDLAAKNAKANNGNNNPTTTNPTKTSNPTVAVTPKVEPEKKVVSYLDFTASDVALNKEFAANKARLPWPVDKGVVTMHFGINQIPGSKITFDSPGITIATPTSGVPVKAVFAGEVSGVYNLGDGMAITIRHGKYFTTYSNLASVSVAKGATIGEGQQIGRAGKDEDGTGGQIDFILMVETRNVDPQPWLHR